MIKKVILDCFGFPKPRNDEGEGHAKPTPNCHAELVSASHFFILLWWKNDRFFATVFKVSPWFSSGFITF